MTSGGLKHLSDLNRVAVFRKMPVYKHNVTSISNHFCDDSPSCQGMRGSRDHIPQTPLPWGTTVINARLPAPLCEDFREMVLTSALGLRVRPRSVMATGLVQDCRDQTSSPFEHPCSERPRFNAPERCLPLANNLRNIC